MNEYIISLRSRTPGGPIPRDVGNKAFTLNQLVRAGLPVPDGFVVTTRAYQDFVLANGIEDRLPGSEGFGEVAGLRSNFLDGTLPEELREAVLAAWRKSALHSRRMAVRSSATCEDLKDASFAGQYETILSVATEVDLLAAIKRCWASLWDERVLHYYSDVFRDVADHRPAMAVIVQHQLLSDVSGVLFTLNPTTGREEEMVVEAVWGMGESLVSGKMTPDRFVIDVKREQIILRHVADKKALTTHLGESENPRDKRMRPSLTDEQVLELAHLGQDVQVVFGCPQDIEWAYHEDRCYLLQSRPLTRFSFAHDIGEWTSVNLQEVLPGFVSVLSQSLSHTHGWDPAMQELFLRLKMMSEPGDHVRWTRLFFGRAYWNAGAVKEYNALLPGFEERAFDRTVGITPSYAGKGRVTGFTPRSIWRGLPVLLALNRSYKEVLAEAKQYCEDFDRRQEADYRWVVPETLSDEGLAAHVRSTINLHCEANRIALLVTFLSTQSQDDFQRMLDGLNRSFQGQRPILMSKLLTGLSGVRTTEPLVKLWRSSRQALLRPTVAHALRETTLENMQECLQSFPEGQRFWQELEDYIQDFRYMAASDEDLSFPRWDEDPTVVLRILKAYVGASSGENPEERIEAQARIRESEENCALARLSHGWNRLRIWQRRSFRRQLALVQRFCWWREETRVVVAWAFYYCRKALLEQGRRWASQGVLKRADDIFWMAKEDLTGLLGGILEPSAVQEVVRSNRWTPIAYRNFAPPPVIVGSGALEPDRRIPDQRRFDGVACGAGTITGRAKVVLSLDEASKLKRGDILIAPYTNPGWTPLFSLVGGIIMEEGGLLSHGAVVARECGIPTVLQIAHATQVFHDGQLLRVNGDTGTVEVLSD